MTKKKTLDLITWTKEEQFNMLGIIVGDPN